MERKNILKKIIASFCLLIIALPSFSQVIGATMDSVGKTGDTAKFGISFLNKKKERVNDVEEN